ncbi:MAG: hypothetical protein HY720_06640 [Planctomycetes bacterium]|nr:hypothetical protein [Planctomycetota bacterium]
MASDRSRELTSLVDGLIPVVLADPRIRVLWIEGDLPDEVRRPYRELDLRMAAMDPDFAGLVADHGAILSRVAPVASHADEDADFEGKRCKATLASGARLVLTLERMSLVGKRSRAEVVPIVDKTGRFRTILNRTGVRS